MVCDVSKKKESKNGDGSTGTERNTEKKMGGREQKETRKKGMKRGKRERRMEKVRNTEK